MKWKLALIFASILISTLILLPTFVPEDSPLTKYLPGKKINLGLDLRGGIHLVLGVEVEKALDVEVDRYVTEVTTLLNDKNVPTESVTRDPTSRHVKVVLRNPQDADAFRKVLKDFFYQVLVIDGWSNDRTASVGLEAARGDQILRDSIEQAREIIRNRVDEFGVAEPIIQIQGSDRILVQLPGVKDPERAIQLIGRTALLEFKMVSEEMDIATLEKVIEEGRAASGFKNSFTSDQLRALNAAVKSKLPVGTEISFERNTDPVSKDVSLRPYLLKSQTVLTGGALEDARVTADQNTQRPQVSLKFNKAGAESFEKITEANVGKLMAIVLDGAVMSAPVIREKIPALSAGATISLGQGSRQTMMNEARDLALVLRSGALPAPVEILENRTVGASLGEDSIAAGEFAGMLGAIVVVLFMLFYYRWSGFLANITMIINTFMLLAVMALFQATLTLPGLAGIVLTVGMAVDANVIILERVREEIRAGKRVKTALEAGYDAAHTAIWDSNLTTLLAGVVLYNFGTGPIRGFAVTLLAGLILNYFTAVWFSRWVYEWYYERRPNAGLSI